MTFVDVVVVAAVATAAGVGWQLGGGIVGGFIAGFGIGLTVGGAYAPVIADPFGAGIQFVIVLLMAFGLATLLAVGGYHLGLRIRERAHEQGGERPERVVGTVAAGSAMLLGLWMVASVLAAAPVGALGSAIHGSALLTAVDRVLPPAPAAFVQIGRHLDGTRQPSLFTGFEPAPPTTAALPDSEMVAAASDAGRAATVQVVAADCDPASSGSGIVVDDDLVVTNAHVIAGTAHPEVEHDHGVHESDPLVFDAQLDVAVLRVPELETAPLPLSGEIVERGEQGAALGFPDPDRTYTAEPAVVIDVLDARGRDLFDEETVERDIYQLITDARGGGSGGPLLRADGTVIGVMFGRAGNHPGVGYALTTPAVNQRIEAARQQSAPVSTGRCL